MLAGSLGLLPSASLGDGPGLSSRFTARRPISRARHRESDRPHRVRGDAAAVRAGSARGQPAASSRITALLTAGARQTGYRTPGEPTLGTSELGAEIARLVLWGGAVEPAL